MHITPSGKEQARRLQAFMARHGTTLAYQDALEEVAGLNGHKNWKTMSAAPVLRPNVSVTPDQPGAEDGPRLQVEIPGTGVQLYEVPITVDTTITALIQARGNSVDEAIEAARRYASDNKPCNFEIDEGNYRSAGDYYCPDEDSVEPLGEPTPPTRAELQSLSFEEDANVEHDGDFWGSFSISTLFTLYRFTATLSRMEPDSSDDDRRAVCELHLKLVYGEGHALEGTVIYDVVYSDYNCYSDDMGRYLEDAFDEGELWELLIPKS